MDIMTQIMDALKPVNPAIHGSIITIAARNGNAMKIRKDRQFIAVHANINRINVDFLFTVPESNLEIDILIQNIRAIATLVCKKIGSGDDDNDGDSDSWPTKELEYTGRRKREKETKPRSDLYRNLCNEPGQHSLQAIRDEIEKTSKKPKRKIPDFEPEF